METNVGDTDSTARIVLGALTGLASLGIIAEIISAPMIASPVLGVLSLILLATGFTSKCALYSALDIDTSE